MGRTSTGGVNNWRGAPFGVWLLLAMHDAADGNLDAFARWIEMAREALSRTRN